MNCGIFRMPFDRLRASEGVNICFNSPRPRFASRRNSIATRAGIDRSFDALQRGIRNLFARATAWIHCAYIFQLL